MFTRNEMRDFSYNGVICKCGCRAVDHPLAEQPNVALILNGCKQFTPAMDETEDTIETTARGGKHSKIKTALTLIPPKALLRVGAVLKPAAEKYGIDNWRNIEQRSHLDHALEHIYAYLAGEETGEDDLVNATCRLLFALETK